MNYRRTFADRDWIGEGLADPHVATTRSAYYEAGHVMVRLLDARPLCHATVKPDHDWPCQSQGEAHACRDSAFAGLTSMAVQEWRRDGDAVDRIATAVSSGHSPWAVVHDQERLSLLDYMEGAAIVGGAVDFDADFDPTVPLDGQRTPNDLLKLVLDHWQEIELVAVALLDRAPVLSRHEVCQILVKADGTSQEP